MATHEITLPDRVAFKAAGGDYSFPFNECAPEGIAFLAQYGLRKIGDTVNGWVNRVVKETTSKEHPKGVKPLATEIRDAVHAEMSRILAGDVAASVKGLRTEAAEAVDLALAIIFANAGCKTLIELAKHPKGAAYVNVSAKGYHTPNVGAILAWVDKWDERFEIKKRAAEIVAAREAGDDAVTEEDLL